jgi:ferredoxin
MGVIEIDGRGFDFHENETVYEVALRNGFSIPALCRLEGYEPLTSCMVCLVEDSRTGEFVPSCSARAADYPGIVTDSQKVREARRAAVELLLGEHLGNCEAPCRRGCPAGVDIPGIIRLLAKGDPAGADALYRERLPFPELMAAVCPAPCERICSRGKLDTPLKIREFEAFLGGAGGKRIDIESGSATRGPAHAKTAVVGAGPAGLSAAYFLRRAGHACVVYDREGKPGGGLAGLDGLEEGVIERTVEWLAASGVRFFFNTEVDGTTGVSRLLMEHGAVILAPGGRRVSIPDLSFGEPSDTPPGGFPSGDYLRGRRTRLAARSIADGRRAALAAIAWLAGRTLYPEKRKFDSHMGRPVADELLMMAEGTRGAGAAYKTGGMDAGDPAAAMRDEAKRCLNCDCICGDSCRLRETATDLDAAGRRFLPADRPSFRRETAVFATGRILSFEPGKCIRCGICVIVSAKGKGETGLAFNGRSSGITIGVPFGGTLAAAFAGTEGVALECARACPTGALASFRKDDQR